jgi:arginase family enzyme
MDPIIIPATGVPEKYGLGLEDLQILNLWLRKLKKVVSVDFVEYNPLLDDKEYSVGKWCVNTIIDLIKNTI